MSSEEDTEDRDNFIGEHSLIDEVDSELDRLRDQFELYLDNKQPVYEDFSVFRGQLGLPIKVAFGEMGLLLTFEQTSVDVLDVVLDRDHLAVGHAHVKDDSLGRHFQLLVFSIHNGGCCTQI